MSEQLDWSQQSREKQKLMSEALTIAKNAVEKLSSNNFYYIDPAGEERIKREFTWPEFSPKDQDNKRLLDKKSDILNALGVNIEDKQDGYQSRRREDGALEEVWPTLIPELKYIRIRANYPHPDESEYFIIENLSDWNKRMWDQPDADRKAEEELNKEGDK